MPSVSSSSNATAPDTLSAPSKTSPLFTSRPNSPKAQNHHNNRSTVAASSLTLPMPLPMRYECAYCLWARFFFAAESTNPPSSNCLWPYLFFVAQNTNLLSFNFPINASTTSLLADTLLSASTASPLPDTLPSASTASLLPDTLPAKPLTRAPQKYTSDARRAIAAIARRDKNIDPNDENQISALASDIKNFINPPKDIETIVDFLKRWLNPDSELKLERDFQVFTGIPLPTIYTLKRQEPSTPAPCKIKKQAITNIFLGDAAKNVFSEGKGPLEELAKIREINFPEPGAKSLQTELWLLFHGEKRTIPELKAITRFSENTIKKLLFQYEHYPNSAKNSEALANAYQLPLDKIELLSKSITRPRSDLAEITKTSKKKIENLLFLSSMDKATRVKELSDALKIPVALLETLFRPEKMAQPDLEKITHISRKVLLRDWLDEIYSQKMRSAALNFLFGHAVNNLLSGEAGPLEELAKIIDIPISEELLKVSEKLHKKYGMAPQGAALARLDQVLWLFYNDQQYPRHVLSEKIAITPSNVEKLFADKDTLIREISDVVYLSEYEFKLLYSAKEMDAPVFVGLTGLSAVKTQSLLHTGKQRIQAKQKTPAQENALDFSLKHKPTSEQPSTAPQFKRKKRI